MPDFPAHFIRPAPVRQPRLPVPPLRPDEWKATALAMLPMLTEAGQRDALKHWKTLRPSFTPPLP